MTKAGSSDLERPIAIRPTSETVMYPYYAKVDIIYPYHAPICTDSWQMTPKPSWQLSAAAACPCTAQNTYLMQLSKAGHACTTCMVGEVGYCAWTCSL